MTQVFLCAILCHTTKTTVYKKMTIRVISYTCVYMCVPVWCVCVCVFVGRWGRWVAEFNAIIKDLGCVAWVGDPYHLFVRFNCLTPEEKSRWIVENDHRLYCRLNPTVVLIVLPTLYMVPLLEWIHKASSA